MAQNRVTRGLLNRAADDVSVLAYSALPDYVFGQHGQAAIEKYYKALLNELGIGFPRTHDLGSLYNLLIVHENNLPGNLDIYSVLTNYALEFRYDDNEDVTLPSRQKCIEIVHEVRDYVLARIAQISGI